MVFCSSLEYKPFWETEAARVLFPCTPLTRTVTSLSIFSRNISADNAARPAAAESAKQRQKQRATLSSKLLHQCRAGCSSGTFFGSHRVFGIIKMIYEYHWFGRTYNNQGLGFFLGFFFPALVAFGFLRSVEAKRHLAKKGGNDSNIREAMLYVILKL